MGTLNQKNAKSNTVSENSETFPAASCIIESKGGSLPEYTQWDDAPYAVFLAKNVDLK